MRIWVSLVILELAYICCCGFLFDDFSNGLSCQGITMLCPPMCRKLDARGCVTCDCSHVDPSHPESLASGPGNSDPSKPINGQTSAASSRCNNDWKNCLCVPQFSQSTGCLECPCGMQTSPTQQPHLSLTNTSPPFTSTTPKRTTSFTASSSVQVSPMTTSASQVINSTALLAQTTTTPTSVNSASSSQSSTNISTSQLIPTTGAGTTIFSTDSPTSTVGSSTSPVTPFFTQTPTTMTSSTLNTNLPIIATVPDMNSSTSVQISVSPTTKAPFLCPGVFNCSLDCYAGFTMDNNGCPLCQCAAIPTDLP